MRDLALSKLFLLIFRFMNDITTGCGTQKSGKFKFFLVILSVMYLRYIIQKVHNSN